MLNIQSAREIIYLLVFAHCDTLDGPVVKTARAVLHKAAAPFIFTLTPKMHLNKKTAGIYASKPLERRICVCMASKR